jgi:hypothetical protein
VTAAAQQPNVPSIQWCAAVPELGLVVDEHPVLGTSAAWRLTPSTCLSTNAIAKLHPRSRRVEGCESLSGEVAVDSFAIARRGRSVCIPMFVSTPSKQSDDCPFFFFFLAVDDPGWVYRITG